MTGREGMLLVMPSIFDDESATFHVVVNHEDQYSIWPDFLDIPDGWKQTPRSGTKQECLDYINEVWTDMRPHSLRVQLGDRG